MFDHGKFGADALTPKGKGHGCGYCEFALPGGACGHKRHARFQREPDMRCSLYRYKGGE